MAASSAVSGYGTCLQLSDGGGTPVFTTVAEVVSLSSPKADRTAIDVSHMLSDNGYREFIGGRVDNGEVQATLNWLPTDATHIDFATSIADQTDTGGLLNTDVLRTWRIVWPDSATSLTVTFVTTTGTTSTHGWNTAQPVRFSTSGTMPTGLTAGVWYFAKRLSSTTFSVHATSADAVAGASAISPSGGSGTLTVYSGTMFTFVGLVTGIEPEFEIDDKLMQTVTIKISTITTITP